MDRQSIAAYRTSLGWSQSRLAETLGVTQATVANWETRVYEPKASQLRMLAETFGVLMDEIDFEADPDRAVSRRRRPPKIAEPGAGS